jgi:peptide methionine sulfoxide reductase MsrB
MRCTICGKEFDPASRETFFCSLDKFRCGCGWPFTKPLETKSAEERLDADQYDSHCSTVRAWRSPIGRLFGDSSLDKGGLRYCINSASSRFISVQERESEGYGERRKLFERELKAQE